MVHGHGTRTGGNRGSGGRFSYLAGMPDESIAMDSCFRAGEIVQPHERDEEKRNVHRVREYWLEHEAMRYLPQLLSFRLPVTSFESHFNTVNRHNPKFSRASMRETIKTFFREHVDSSTGSRCLSLKLSEREVCVKPSKNILKRWNLSNGMLYFFYAAIGRTTPPSGEEILEPFYFQKRVDFIRKVCLPSDQKAADAAGDNSSTSSSKSQRTSSSSITSTVTAGGRKRARREYTEVMLPPAELQVAVPNDDPSSLVAHLLASFPGQVEESAIRLSIEAGLWQPGVQAAGMGLAGSAAESAAVLAYLEEKPGPRYFWAPAFEKLESWTFQNGALLVFVRACLNRWARLAQVWAEWNEDLGNNAMEWQELWKVPALPPTTHLLLQPVAEAQGGEEQLFKMDMCDEAAAVVPDDDDDFAKSGHGMDLGLDPLGHFFMADFPEGFEIAPLVGSLGDATGLYGCPPAEHHHHQQHGSAAIYQPPSTSVEVFDMGGEASSWYNQWTQFSSSLGSSVMIKEEQPAITHHHHHHQQQQPQQLHYAQQQQQHHYHHHQLQQQQPGPDGMYTYSSCWSVDATGQSK